MSANSGIEWTHHTFNPWWGCEKISPACQNCYAEAWAKRVGQKVWGRNAPRRFFATPHWEEPRRWNQRAAADDVRRRVFCASMADVFEDRDDLAPAREQLWTLIDETPQLDWLLLTKRIELVRRIAPWGSLWPRNVWLGTTVESQAYVSRIGYLTQIPAAVRFLSCEPLLGRIELTSGVDDIHWVIVGGESGVRARELHLDWARQLRDDCSAHSIAFFFKQVGGRRDKKSALLSIPSDLRIRQFPMLPTISQECVNLCCGETGADVVADQFANAARPRAAYSEPSAQAVD
jgi:protein gp37